MKTTPGSVCTCRASVLLVLQLSLLAHPAAAAQVALRGSPSVVDLPVADSSNGDGAIDFAGLEVPTDVASVPVPPDAIEPAIVPAVDSNSSFVAGQEGSDDSDSLDDEAAKKEVTERLIHVSDHAKALRKLLTQQLSRDRSLQGELNSAQATSYAQQQQLQQLADQVQQVSSTLEAERTHEGNMKRQLNMTHGSIKDVVTNISNVQRQLQYVKDSLQEVKKAEHQAKDEEKDAKQENSTKADKLRAVLKEQLHQQDRARNAVFHFGHVKRVLMAKEKTLHDVQRKKAAEQKALEAKVALLQAQLNKTKSAVLSAKKALNVSRHVNQDMRDKVAESSEHQLQLGQTLQKQRSATKEREESMKKKISMKKMITAAKQDARVRIRTKLDAYNQHVKSKVGNLTSQLHLAHAHVKKLEVADQALKLQIAGNAKQIERLSKQTGKLREHIQHSDDAIVVARAKIDAEAKELAQAKAIAKQLAGTVPQLVEQTHLARAARDAEKDMRAKTEQAIVNMQQQYNTAVQAQLIELDRKVTEVKSPVASAKATAPAVFPALPAGIEDVASDLEGDLNNALHSPVHGSEEEESAQSSLAPDLTGDSQGLGALLQSQ